MKNIIFLLFIFLVSTSQAQSKKELRKLILEQQLKIQQLDSTLLNAQNRLVRKDEKIHLLDRSLKSANEDKRRYKKTVNQTTTSIRRLQNKNSDLETKLAHWEKYKKPMKKPQREKTTVNPFGSGGSGNTPFGRGGSGSGSFGKKGDGQGAGYDGPSGSGKSPSGLGDGSGRTRLNDPKVDNITSDKNHTIYLKVQINAAGKVVTVYNLAAKTTTTDQRILSQVIAAVKSQVRYSKKAGAGLEQTILSIHINAN